MPFNRARGLGKEKIYESIGKYLSKHNKLKCEPKSKTLPWDELEMFFEYQCNLKLLSIHRGDTIEDSHLKWISDAITSEDFGPKALNKSLEISVLMLYHDSSQNLPIE